MDKANISFILVNNTTDNTQTTLVEQRSSPFPIPALTHMPFARAIHQGKASIPASQNSATAMKSPIVPRRSSEGYLANERKRHERRRVKSRWRQPQTPPKRHSQTSTKPHLYIKDASSSGHNLAIVYPSFCDTENADSLIDT